MMRAIYTAATGMVAQQMNIDVIANNLTNLNSPGFKRARLQFQDLAYQDMKQAGASAAQGVPLPVGLQVGLGTRPASTPRLFTQGELQQTDNPMDLAIEGDGFFEVHLPDGSRGYTRDGSFTMDAQGRVVTHDGYPLAPELVVPAEATGITIGSDGIVSAVLQGIEGTQLLGQLQTVRFTNPTGLQALGRNLYQPTDASGPAQAGIPGENGFGRLSQGYLELSNVQVVEEMVKMIISQRAYEANSRAIQMSDEMLGAVANLRR